jgi:hypothetical protein
LLGVSNLSSLGDLSDKYLGLFDNKTGDNKLSVLQLGNSHKDYYNPNWSRLTTDLDLSNFNSL